MTSTFRRAFVYVYNVYAGELCETDEGYSFSYDKEYLSSGDAHPVSLTLPIREESYTRCV